MSVAAGDEGRTLGSVLTSAITCLEFLVANGFDNSKPPEDTIALAAQNAISLAQKMASSTTNENVVDALIKRYDMVDRSKDKESPCVPTLGVAFVMEDNGEDIPFVAAYAFDAEKKDVFDGNARIVHSLHFLDISVQKWIEERHPNAFYVLQCYIPLQKSFIHEDLPSAPQPVTCNFPDELPAPTPTAEVSEPPVATPTPTAPVAAVVTKRKAASAVTKKRASPASSNDVTAEAVAAAEETTTTSSKRKTAE